MKSFTYLVYILLWEGFTIGGCCYVVFGLNQSGWWFLLAIAFSVMAYSPEVWANLDK